MKRMRPCSACWLTGISLLLCAPVQAAAAADNGPPAVFGPAYLVQVIGSLALVLACLFGLLWLMRRMGGVPAGDQQSLRVKSSMRVGSREKILLLEIGDSQLLVGVAPGNVRTLHVLPTDPQAGSGSAASGGDFASFLPAGTTRPEGGA